MSHPEKWTRRASLVFRDDGDAADHIGMEAAEIFVFAGRAELSDGGFAGGEKYVEAAAAFGRRAMRHEILVDPFDAVASVNGEVDRREGEILDDDLDGLAGRGRARAHARDHATGAR